MNRLKEKYIKEVTPSLVEKSNHSPVMQAPKIDKIVIGVGVGDAVSNAKSLDKVVEELVLVTGQGLLITKARRSIAGFRLREGMSIGAEAVLRGKGTYGFLDKLVAVSLPCVRDFHGVSKKTFDGRGNYTLGTKRRLVFPGADYDLVNKVRGMGIVIVATVNTDGESRGLLAQLGMPLQK